MRDNYNMRHAKKTPIKWKIIISTFSGILGVAIIYLAYLYFPIVTGLIDRGIDYLFKPENPIEEQEIMEEDSMGETGGNNPEEEIKEKEPKETFEEIIEENVEKESEEEEETPEQYIAPTIKLRIYEGPLYSKDDDICYYRIIADVTGEPIPEIVFTKDDSLGSLGPGKAQINISRDNGPYTLSATARNSEGTVSDNITLIWNCNRSPDISGIQLSADTLYVGEQYEVSAEVVDLDGDDIIYSWSVSGGSLEEASLNPAKWNTPNNPGDYTISISVTDGAGNTSDTSISVYVGTVEVEDTVVLNLPRKESEGGYIEYGGATNAGGNMYAGDSEGNKPCSGFISFDISGISGKTVTAASLTLTGASVSGDPIGFFDTFWINSLEWGAEPITQDDFNLTGIAIANYSSPNITCNVAKLKEELQKAINGGKSRFQIRIHFGGAYTDDDNTSDGWGYAQSNVNMNVTISQ